jgi:hypothetical protein
MIKWIVSKKPVAVDCHSMVVGGKCTYSASNFCPLNIGNIREGKRCCHASKKQRVIEK